MITLAERLGAIAIEVGFQQLSNDVAILAALGDIVRNGGDDKTMKTITKALEETTKVLNKVADKLEAIKATGGSNAIN